MMALEAGHMECFKELLDKGAEVNIQDKVNGVIIHCYMQCSMYQESPVLNEDVLRTLLCVYMYIRCCLMTESSTCLDVR